MRYLLYNRSTNVQKLPYFQRYHYQRHGAEIFSSEYIQVDESVIPMMDNEKHKVKRGMSGAYAMASRGTSCSIMTVAAVRAW